MFGPGVVTGASDDDPSGIGTYSQAGAQFGFQVLWTMLLTYPLMAAIQEVAARIGRVTGRGLAGNLRRSYPRWLLYSLVGLLIVANTVNIGADIGAMGAAAELLFGGPPTAYGALFALLSLGLQIFIPYHRYARFLMWSTAALLSYVAVGAVIGMPWGRALRATVLPSMAWTADDVMMIVAVLGTTISPYLFFWQASQEVEDEEGDPAAKPLARAPRQAPRQLRRLRIDTLVGMAASNIIAWFIMVATAATLHPRGIRQIESAAQAASALEPIAGRLASLLFAAGIVGTGLLAIPVLAGSASYAVSEAMDLTIGLERKPRDARAFYGIIAASTLVGLALTLAPVNPMKALVYSAVVNGVVAVPVMVMMMLIGSSRRVMLQFVLPRGLRIIGWVATGVMLVATVAMFMTLGRS
jgi:NRAMP (natural resistance-associated macrophage protein)-like metal ion transporter